MSQPFFNAQPPKRLIKWEQPAHRVMLQMAASGYSQKEISNFTGTSLVTVSNTLKQPFAREYLINEAKESIQAEIRELLEKEALPSLRLLTTVRDNPLAKPADRANAANSLLDRFLGKASQPITVQEKPASDLSDDELHARANSILSRFSHS